MSKLISVDNKCLRKKITVLYTIFILGCVNTCIKSLVPIEISDSNPT